MSIFTPQIAEVILFSKHLPNSLAIMRPFEGFFNTMAWDIKSSKYFQVCVWNVETGALECKIAHSAEDSLTTVAWSPDGRRIACGGERGQFYQCDAKNGNVMENKEGVRVQAMAYRKDNKTVLAADKHNRLRSYNLEDESSDKTILSERYGIMNFTIDDSDRFALLTLREQVNMQTKFLSWKNRNNKVG